MKEKSAVLQYAEHRFNDRRMRKNAGKFIEDLNKPGFSVTEEGKLKFTIILLNLAMASFSCHILLYMFGEYVTRHIHTNLELSYLSVGLIFIS